MNENAYETLKYMCIHLFIFLFKNVFSNWLINFSQKGIKNKNNNELELLKQKRDKLREDSREISPINEYAKYAKMERQINNLNDEIKRKENLNYSQQFNDTDMNIILKTINSILNSYIFKFFMFFINIIEYFLLKNMYFEVDHDENSNNILVNYFYDEKINKDYALIPVYRILFCETIALNSLLNLIKDYTLYLL